MALVYSTEAGRICPDCRQPVAECLCKKKAAPAGDGVVRVSRETKGRGGKAVTLVKGVPLADEAALTALAKQLKAACGTGGTVKDWIVEIQGDHVDKIVAWLKAKQPAWTVKRAGG